MMTSLMFLTTPMHNRPQVTIRPCDKDDQPLPVGPTSYTKFYWEPSRLENLYSNLAAQLKSTAVYSMYGVLVHEKGLVRNKKLHRVL